MEKLDILSKNTDDKDRKIVHVDNTNTNLKKRKPESNNNNNSIGTKKYTSLIDEKLKIYEQ